MGKGRKNQKHVIELRRDRKNKTRNNKESDLNKDLRTTGDVKQDTENTDHPAEKQRERPKQGFENHW